jgi:hypothetical protein
MEEKELFEKDMPVDAQIYFPFKSNPIYVRIYINTPDARALWISVCNAMEKLHQYGFFNEFQITSKFVGFDIFATLAPDNAQSSYIHSTEKGTKRVYMYTQPLTKTLNERLSKFIFPAKVTKTDISNANTFIMMDIIMEHIMRVTTKYVSASDDKTTDINNDKQRWISKIFPEMKTQ